MGFEFDLEIIIRLCLAFLWGAIIGLEREYRSKSAGFRTMIMISLGSCLFTMMSVLIGEAGTSDRIASNIVTGIGFLGAGVIFRDENRVNGITTAATIWAVAAVGMGIGDGYYFASFCMGVLILFVLTILPYVAPFLEKLNQSRIYSLRCDFSLEKRSDLENSMKTCSLDFKLIKETKDDKLIILSWEVHGKTRCHEVFISKIMADESVKQFDY